MKLWLLEARSGLSKGDNPWAGTYDMAYGFVIRAKTEAQARNLCRPGDEGKDAWLLSKYSSCEELKAEGMPGEVLQDFHAG